MTNRNSQYDPGLIQKEVHDFHGQSLRVSNSRTIADQYFTHFRATYDGSLPLTVTYYRGTTPHISIVTAVADVAGSLAGKYFLIYSSPDQQAYYVWYQVNGVGADPAVANAVGIEVDVQTNDSAALVALATRLTINASQGTKFTCQNDGANITITTKQLGTTTNSAVGTSGFSISNTAGAQETTNTITLTYDSANNPIYNGQVLIGYEFDIYAGTFQKKTGDTSGKIIPFEFDAVTVTSSDGDGNPLVIEYRFNSVLVATLTMTYLNGNVQTITRT